ncbi:class I SAM-dependent methyltransferase [Aeromicrobium sp. Marseille-Q0843]|uniref:Class I SAM-dependent methyltransferase n=1 Tax=Aeromicrobium phoceense TaxID=2754045 RepID=A0A838XJ43_9ACTN|nr:cyclopropane-fatty-acyl-phospholipid synthase family protein [Aeromicrobium phoceense]MBA4609887.1 class I SAM-dependent methyltransferase [Aeromicrobium phoceense]
MSHRQHIDGLAGQTAAVLEPVVGEIPVRLEFWDGSVVGPIRGPIVRITSPAALRRLLWSPGELGAAQAYVSGEAEIEGDLDAALTTLLAAGRNAGPVPATRTARTMARALPLLIRAGAIGRRPPPPASQAVVKGRLHSRDRDRAAIAHHYDLSNEFYEQILDPTMAYSCGYYTSDDVTLQQAQEAKLSLICRKLGLGEGSRLLDVGCGWGSLTVHAAQHYGAQVVAVTIAAEQRDFVAERVRREGLEHLVEVRLCDYRDATGEYDAAASVEMGEHVGAENYAVFAGVLHDRVRPGGRVLIQQMSRTGRWPGGGPFIESFIAPDMHMRPVGQTVDLLERSGLEVRDVHALREHYVRTVGGWIENFESNVDRLTELVGEEVVRVWRLYLAGGAAAFRDGRMGVDQILAVRPGAPHGLDREPRAW